MPNNQSQIENTLYIGNLSPRVDDTMLWTHFQRFGAISSCRVMRDLYSGQSRRFAFLGYNKKEDAEKAKKELNYTDFEGYELRIYFKKSPGDFKPEGNVFFNNLDPKVSAKKLHQLCEKFGDIMSCTIRTDDSGQSLGYGYVQYYKSEDADKCIENMNDVEIEGKKAQV